MAVEIERKFLVAGSAWRREAGVRLSQGYLNRDKERTVRVRLAGAQAFLTLWLEPARQTQGLTMLNAPLALPQLSSKA